MEHFKWEPLSKFYRPKDTILTWAMSPIFMWRWKWVAKNVLKFSGISSTHCLIFPRISPSPTFYQPSRRPFSPAFFKRIQSILCWSSILQSLVSQSTPILGDIASTISRKVLLQSKYPAAASSVLSRACFVLPYISNEFCAGHQYLTASSVST